MTGISSTGEDFQIHEGLRNTMKTQNNQCHGEDSELNLLKQAYLMAKIFMQVIFAPYVNYKCGRGPQKMS